MENNMGKNSNSRIFPLWRRRGKEKKFGIRSLEFFTPEEHEESQRLMQ